MIERLERHDWAATPLGARAAWPASLRTTVDMMMASGHAMCLAWGPERIFLYNDAYVPMLGPRHPSAFGALFADVWPDVWGEIAPLVDAAYRGETSTFQDMPLTMHRHGHPEETWWTFSYSPVRDEQGAVAGMLNVTLDTTARVIAERERDRAVAELQHSEAKWRRLFETMEEGFILGVVVRDDHGRIADWRYEEVNDAWYRLVGLMPGSAPQRTIRELFPDIEDEWVREVERAVDQHQLIRFTRQVGALNRWYDGVVKATGDDRFTIVFTEVTERVRRERYQAAIIELADRWQEEPAIAGMACAAAATIGAALDVQRVGYGDVDPAGEIVTIEREWSATETVSSPGPVRLSDFGDHVDRLRAGRIVAIDDVRTDPLTRDHAGALEAGDVRAFVNAPIVERGAFVALLYVSSAQPRAWSHEDLRFIRDVADRLRSAVERLRATEQQEILNGELSHRVKNTLSVVQAIAMQTLAPQAERAAVDEFGKRLRALAGAHDVLLTRSWAPAELKDVVDAALASFPGTQIATGGPSLRIGARAAMSLSLLIHELATNAVKYGALSTAQGCVTVEWALRDDGGVTQLEMGWCERGGPPAAEPTRRGFGSRIIRMGLSGSGGVQLHYGSEGLTVAMTAPLDQVQQA